MTELREAYYKRMLKEVHLKMLLADYAREVDRHRAKAWFYETRLKELGQVYDPTTRRFECCVALGDS